MSARPTGTPALPRVVPTLTEVVQVTAPRPFGAQPAASPPAAVQRPTAPGVPKGAAVTPALMATRPAPAATAPIATAPGAAAPAAADQALAQRVLLDVQRQVDLLLEQRLRETLSPLIARLAGELVSEAREQLAATLRELITQAVAREMARRREP